MIGIVLAFLVAFTPHGIPTSGTATWYGSTHPKGEKYCYGGYRNTCNPYSKGEQVWYAAVGTWRYHDEPYKVEVCRKDKRERCVVVVVRDYCHGAWQYLNHKGNLKSRRAIDLSPKAFLTLAPLSRGVLNVIIREVNWNTEVGKVLVNKWRNQ